ncbi:hypothetical protein C427_1854 [Paraglaciecola psychrophila 170]|uniref:Transposase n=1 Tax=Paraglaciecola psychrophila 170 TaxID=1129794 RepID=M4RMZ5_9ALTE|nr:hypothetical protein C427_1854 [Paraglaciecola psychrophila 170]
MVEFKLPTFSQAWLIDEFNDYLRSQPQMIKNLNYSVVFPSLS